MGESLQNNKNQIRSGDQEQNQLRLREPSI